jgi:putative hydrolase of the HAD superfamily
MIETALNVSNKTAGMEVIEKTIQYGKDLLAKPIELLDGVEDVLKALQPHYRLVVATKGDLLDQERKLKNSGIAHYFHHIEIMSDKQQADYQKLIKHLDILPPEFAMIGNSLKSDVLPVLQIGGHGFHVPYHVTWAHEKVEHHLAHENFKELLHLKEILALLLL